MNQKKSWDESVGLVKKKYEKPSVRVWDCRGLVEHLGPVQMSTSQPTSTPIDKFKDFPGR